MNDHDHFFEAIVGTILLAVIVAALIHAPCPAGSGLAWVWMNPPYQCVVVVR